jgi:hypothetical protein
MVFRGAHWISRASTLRNTRGCGAGQAGAWSGAGARGAGASAGRQLS